MSTVTIAPPVVNNVPSAAEKIAAATGAGENDWASPTLEDSGNEVEALPGQTWDEAMSMDSDETPEGTTPDSTSTESATPVTTTTVSEEIATEELIEIAPGQSIKLNLSDKQAVSEYIRKAMNSDSLLKEKETLSVERNAMEARLRELENEFEVLEDAMDVDGIAGLVNKLAKDETAYGKWFASEVEKEIAYRNATPEGKAAIEAQRRADLLERKLTAQGKKTERTTKKEAALNEKKQAEAAVADRARVTNMAHSLFKKHSFEGKMDADAAKAIDSAVWGNAMTELSSMPKGTQVTEQLLGQLFEKHSKVFSKTITKSTEKHIEQKKDDARGALDAAAVNSKQAVNSAAGDFLKAQAGGTMADRLKAAAKFLRG